MSQSTKLFVRLHHGGLLEEMRHSMGWTDPRGMWVDVSDALTPRYTKVRTEFTWFPRRYEVWRYAIGGSELIGSGFTEKEADALLKLLG